MTALKQIESFGKRPKLRDCINTSQMHKAINTRNILPYLLILEENVAERGLSKMGVNLTLPYALSGNLSSIAECLNCLTNTFLSV